MCCGAEKGYGLTKKSSTFRGDYLLGESRWYSANGSSVFHLNIALGGALPNALGEYYSPRMLFLRERINLDDVFPSP